MIPKNKSIGTRRSRFRRVAVSIAVLAITRLSVNAGFESYVIRAASAAPNNPPVIQPNNVYVPNATEFIIAEGGQKAGLGSSDIDGSALGQIQSLNIDRLDNRTRFALGSGPAVAPYFNIWITDGLGHYAVVANEPSDGVFQPLYNNGYHLTWADLKDKVAKVYENSDLSWLPTHGSSGLPAQSGRQNSASANLYTFADLAGYIVHAPSVAELSAGWPGLGSGAPRELGTSKAWGVNWIFGDSLVNYVSGNEGYVVANAAVTAPAATATDLVVNVNQAGGAGNNLASVSGDFAPGYPGGSIQANATAANQKSETYFDTATLFGRSVLVGEIKNLRYWTKSGSHVLGDPRDWSFLLYTQPFPGDLLSAPWYGARFGAEPYFSVDLNDANPGWHQWSTDGLDNRLRFYESTAGAPGANFGTYTDPTWDLFIDSVSLGTIVPRRNQEVLYFSLQTGSAWANGFTGLLDGFEVELQDGSVATINFEAVDQESPIARDLETTPGAVSIAGLSDPIILTAVIDDSTTGGSAIVSAEFKVGNGAWMPLAATDGTFDTSTESVTSTFDLASADPAISAPGLYDVQVRGTDAQGNTSEPAHICIAVYDPSAGFATGGGWLYSPAGALVDDPTASGKATFGFVSKYKKGASIPDGSTEFVFNAGELNFHSTSYQWLLVNAGGQNAQFKGEGTINGIGTFAFMIWANDGGKTGADTFRIHISDANGTIYDNGVDQPIGGGSIVVKKN